MKESKYNILTERVHNLEKNMDFVVDWLEEISPNAKDVKQEKKKYGIKDLGPLPPFFFFIL